MIYKLWYFTELLLFYNIDENPKLFCFSIDIYQKINFFNLYLWFVFIRCFIISMKKCNEGNKTYFMSNIT